MALLLLAVAVLPVQYVRSYRVERVLVRRHEQLIFSGLMCMGAAAVVSLLVLLGG